MRLFGSGLVCLEHVGVDFNFVARSSFFLPTYFFKDNFSKLWTPDSGGTNYTLFVEKNEKAS
jgi:hypothetical protein